MSIPNVQCHIKVRVHPKFVFELGIRTDIKLVHSKIKTKFNKIYIDFFLLTQ